MLTQQADHKIGQKMCGMSVISEYYQNPRLGIGINLSHPMKKPYGRKLQFVKTVWYILGKLDIIFNINS
jgi:hypothetical protein